MEKTKILILGSSQEIPRLQVLREKLEQLGVMTELFDIALDQEHIFSLITQAKNIVFFISKDCVNSDSLSEEFLLVYEYAKNRDKKILPVIEEKQKTLNGISLEIVLESKQIIYSKDGLHSQEDCMDIAGEIYDICIHSEKKELLYEKIANLFKINYIPGISSNLSDLILLLCNEVAHDQNTQSRRSVYKELLRCLEYLNTSYPGYPYTEKNRKLAHKRLAALNEVDKVLKNDDFHTLDLFFISFVIKVIYLDYSIRREAVDILTYGDLHGLGGDMLQEKYLSRQNFYFRLYNSQIISENITDTFHGKYDEDEIPLILEAKKFLILDEVGKGKTQHNSSKKEIRDTENRLHAIADYMKESNKLFELVGRDNLAADFLKCLKTSYERLRKYSEVVNCLEICAECIERIAEINQQLEQLDEAYSEDGLAESGLKALLGFSLPNEDNFDVFISYKHEDLDIARSLYHFLKSNILNPFFDSISLPQLSTAEYEDAIMNAIEHSKHFIVIISNLDYLNSDWVELEMKTFRHEMVEGRKNEANFIIIVTNDVFQKIVATNKQCLPIKYRSYEIMRVDDYKKSIINYLK